MEQKKLKIAIFVDSYYPIIDGVSLVVNNYARLLAKKHDVTVFVPKSVDKTYEDKFPYKVVRCKISKLRAGEYSFSMPAFDRELKNMLKKEKFDIVHIHSPFIVGRFGIKYANKNNIPVVITCHSQFHQDFKRITKSRIITKFLVNYVAGAFNGCGELWTMNPKLKEMVRSYGYKGKVFLIPNGCDMKNEGFEQDYISGFRLKYASPEEKLIIFVGRIYALKNIGFILKVCKCLKERDFKFKMLFIGSGKELEKFKKQCKKLKLEDRVSFVGVVRSRKELEAYYAVSDLLVFPSKYDTDGLVKSEAAVFEKPTIFLKDTIASSVVQDGKNGYIGENNQELFADKIIKIFEDIKTYGEVCKKAKETLYFTWEQVLDNAEKEYYKVIEQNKRKISKKTRKNMIKKVKRSKRYAKKDAK